MARSEPSLDRLFHALGDPTRLRLLNLVAQGEICVCFFVSLLGESQTKISRHLAYLRRTGLVAARRDGKWMHYSLCLPAAESEARVLRATLDSLRELPLYRRDAEALSRACCSVRLPAGLQEAPRPVLTRRRV